MFFFFKQKTAYEMRISDWSSDVCSSDLQHPAGHGAVRAGADDEHGRSGLFQRLHGLADRLDVGGRPPRMAALQRDGIGLLVGDILGQLDMHRAGLFLLGEAEDRKSTRLNSSH